MIKVETEPDDRYLVVTFPMIDKIVIFMFCIFCPVSYVVYEGMAGRDLRTLHGPIIFLLFSSFLAIVGLRTRVVIGRSKITETFFITRRFELPAAHVSIIRRGPIVCLTANDPPFEYRFPKGLAHGDKLEKALDLFFSGNGEAVLPENPESG